MSFCVGLVLIVVLGGYLGVVSPPPHMKDWVRPSVKGLLD